ncbi:hypothetical protein TRFO_16526 [Tritrichomonas foetus]|uniref:Leucine Rich Repeat family protein n=1 Tax=Tritrichomonas foetus TaxID=1144522 RepID=A0A1J4KUI8_9EUKA|nr:hypothetical protein TRFO_16526 [Tritrichomonas foetus]|eukprot:OHT13326.1 hypothetical protein TRFO_16526 [Tritrichomonas foetus]
MNIRLEISSNLEIRMADLNEVLIKNLAEIDQKLITFENIKLFGALKMKSSKLAVLSDKCFAIFSKSGRRKKYCYWIQLTNFSWDTNSITLRFGRTSFHFSPNTMEGILKYIFDVLQRVLVSTELKSLFFSNAHAFVSWPNALSIISRIKQKIILSNTKIDENTLHKISTIFTFSKPRINLNKFPIHTIPIILDALPLSRTVRDFTICTTPELDAYSLLSKYMLEFNRTRRIEIKGPINSNFDAFIKNIESNINKKLFTLSFDSSVLEEPHLKSIMSLVKTSGVQGLEFHDAFSASSEEFFYTSFFPKDQILPLTILNLDRTPNVDVSRLIPQIPDVSLLSLENCNLDISSIIPKLSGLPKLRAVNLSGNKCVDLTNLPAQLPENLMYVDVNNVKWERGCIQKFMNYHLVRLSISQINTAADEWQSLFDFLPTCTNYLLTTFIWNGNKIHKNLFIYLEKNSSLQILSLNECFTYSSPETLTPLAVFLQNKSSHLKVFSLRGSSRNFLGYYIKNIINAVASSHTLDVLDITDQQGGHECLQQLYQNASKFKVIACDGSNPMTLDWILALFKMTSQFNTLLSYPEKDIGQLLSNWTKAQQEELLSKLARNPPIPKKQPSNIMFQPIVKSNYDQPCLVFKYYRDILEFPRTLRKTEIATCRNPQMLPDHNVNSFKQINAQTTNSQVYGDDTGDKTDLINKIKQQQQNQFQNLENQLDMEQKLQQQNLLHRQQIEQQKLLQQQKQQKLLLQQRQFEFEQRQKEERRQAEKARRREREERLRQKDFGENNLNMQTKLQSRKRNKSVVPQRSRKENEILNQYPDLSSEDLIPQPRFHRKSSKPHDSLLIDNSPPKSRNSRTPEASTPPNDQSKSRKRGSTDKHNQTPKNKPVIDKNNTKTITSNNTANVEDINGNNRKSQNRRKSGYKTKLAMKPAKEADYLSSSSTSSSSSQFTNLIATRKRNPQMASRNHFHSKLNNPPRQPSGRYRQPSQQPPSKQQRQSQQQNSRQQPQNSRLQQQQSPPQSPQQSTPPEKKIIKKRTKNILDVERDEIAARIASRKGTSPKARRRSNIKLEENSPIAAQATSSNNHPKISNNNRDNNVRNNIRNNNRTLLDPDSDSDDEVMVSVNSISSRSSVRRRGGQGIRPGGRISQPRRKNIPLVLSDSSSEIEENVPSFKRATRQKSPIKVKNRTQARDDAENIQNKANHTARIPQGRRAASARRKS